MKFGEVKHRKKNKVLKFLEIDELQNLERPLYEKAKKAFTKDEKEMKTSDKVAIRDFALLTLLYGCALRISEATNLKIHNLLIEKAQVIIIDSKSDDRIVDVPAPVLEVLKEWLEIRPKNTKNEYVFCNVKYNAEDKNKPITRQYYNRLIRNLAIITNTTLRGGDEIKLPSPHTFRHSRAMAIHDDGVELEIIQRILGHRNLQTTQVYAHARREEIRKVQLGNTKGISTL